MKPTVYIETTVLDGRKGLYRLLEVPMRNPPTLRWTRTASLVFTALCISAGQEGCARKVEKVSTNELSFSGEFKTPESVLHDEKADVYFVSSINRRPSGEDKAGFISKLRPDDSVQTWKWIDGSKEGITLNAPKGMAIAGDVLHVADVTTVRKFDRKSGIPLGEIPIEGATFLNDLAAADDGTVYVSDTGLGKDFSPTGTDAIHAIEPDGKVKVLAKDKDLEQPNGLLAEGNDVLFVSWGGGVLRRVSRDGKVALVVKLPKGQLDGIVKDKGGDYLISSWEGSCVYRVSARGEVSVFAADIQAPADLGFDSKRGRLLVPLFNADKVLGFAVR